MDGWMDVVRSCSQARTTEVRRRGQVGSSNGGNREPSTLSSWAQKPKEGAVRGEATDSANPVTLCDRMLLEC